MKVIKEEFEVESSGNLIEIGAAIKATTKAFQVLSSNLYSDKILAIVRELSCNAWDSHVSAGKSDVAIDVHLPTALDCTFYVKDYGLGMSDLDIRGGYTAPDGSRVSHEQGRGKLDHTQFHGIYTTFFDSTKTDSDDVIGQLGLGSKSPYAYAHTFTVESRFDGQKRIYTCYKNTRGEPSITLLDTSDTDESNGMTISLAVAKNDIFKFAEAARKALMYFQPTPRVIGQRNVIPYSLEHTIEGTTWKVRKSEWAAQMSGSYVVQGFIAYPIDVYQLEQNGLSQVGGLFARANIDIFVPIGMVDPAPSREALSYDQRTIKNLIEAITLACEEVRASFQQRLDQCTSKWDMMMAFDELLRGGDEQLRKLFNFLHAEQPFVWNGKAIDTKVALDLTEVTSTAIYVCKLFGTGRVPRLKIMGSWLPSYNLKEFTLNVASNTHVLIDSEVAGTNSKIALLLQSTPSVNQCAPVVFLLRPSNRGDVNMPEMLSIVESLGNPEPIYVDDLPAPRRSTRQYVTSSKARRQTGQYPVFTGFASKKRGSGYRARDILVREFGRKTWTMMEIDLADGGLYVPIDKYAIVYKNSTGADRIDFQIDSFLSHAKSIGFIDNKFVLPGFTAKEIEKLDSTKWTCLYDYVQTRFEKEFIQSHCATQLATVRVIEQLLPRALIRNVIGCYGEIAPKLSDGVFKDLTDRIYAALVVSTKTNMEDHVVFFKQRFEVVDTESELPHQLADEFSALNKTYKYITLFEWNDYTYDSTRFNLLLEYIKEVDMKRAAQAGMHARVEMSEEMEHSE